MNGRILVIDDDRELCEETKEFLELEGYAVDIAFDGHSGKKLLGTGVYDIVLLDCKLPDADGMLVLNDIQHIAPGTRIFLVTGKPFVEKLLQQNNTLKLAVKVMQKPLDPEELLKALKT